LGNPQGLAFDSAGNLYAANQGGNNIDKFTPAGVGSVFNVSGNLADPKGVAFDSGGNLYSPNNFGVEKFTPSGIGSSFSSSGGQYFIAIVPEPPTLALVAVGAGALLVRHHRKCGRMKG
jgi:hypothetical protein